MSTITIYYQNVRGLRSKQNEFFGNSSAFGYSIIVLTETWLNSTFFSSEYFNNSFIVHRTDRETTGSTRQLGGGTLIAVSETFESSALNLNGFDDIEYTAVKIKLNQRQLLYIYAAYIPPSSSIQLYNKHITAIRSITLGNSDFFFNYGGF